MSTLPPQPEMTAIDAAFVDLVLAFLEQVLRVPTPVRDSIKHMEISETADSWIQRSHFTYQQWAVTVILTTPLPLIGDIILLAVDNRSGHYSINRLFFRPGWKPAKEQAEPDETYIDFAEHLPPAVWKTSQARTCSLTAACLSCHAEMHGEWEGESPYTLVCPSCGQSYTIEERIS